MFKISEDVMVIGQAELRDEMPKLSKELKFKTIIITRRGKPVAVLEDFERHEEKKELIDAFEDMILGQIAKDRDENGKPSDYLSQKDLAKKLGIKL